jgi:hypothetical protein
MSRVYACSRCVPVFQGVAIRPAQYLNLPCYTTRDWTDLGLSVLTIFLVIVPFDVPLFRLPIPASTKSFTWKWVIWFFLGAPWRERPPPFDYFLVELCGFIDLDNTMADIDNKALVATSLTATYVFFISFPPLVLPPYTNFLHVLSMIRVLIKFSSVYVMLISRIKLARKLLNNLTYMWENACIYPASDTHAHYVEGKTGKGSQLPTLSLCPSIFSTRFSASFFPSSLTWLGE